MYTIIMYNGTTVEHFMGGFEDCQEAFDICEYYNWVYYDENQFLWQLDIIKE